ncbi:MAG TPA: fluoride efflux transporter CrcB [Burkholderiaceae bacterium]|nr:fluoride efflux transporter CrcB [Burkholderiaceae bacterium]
MNVPGATGGLSLWVGGAAVFIGAGVGAVARWVLSMKLPLWQGFPLGTLAANLIGAFLIGMLAVWLAGQQGMNPLLRLALMTGLLGGLTTFSTFSLESVTLIQNGRALEALLHAGLHLMGSLLLVALGVSAARAALS